MASVQHASSVGLTARVGSADVSFVRRLFGLTIGSTAAPHRPARLVVDAHVPLSPNGCQLAGVAREAGVPFLIDPETSYLQDSQHSAAPWCSVPFARAEKWQPADLMNAAAQDSLVKEAIDYQVAHGATAVIAPYVHVERPTLGWVQVQAGLWRRTAAYVKEAEINLPVVALVSVGWRCLNRIRGIPALMDMWTALAALRPDEVALAASKVDVGANPADRIAELLSLVRRLASTYTVTMWQQGILGEACVAEGAQGYECGIGRRERCDIQSRIAQYRKPSSGHPGPRAVYIREMGRSVPKSRLELARAKRTLWSRLICPFPDCCAPAGEDLLNDARRHSIVSRARDFDMLTATTASRWRWNMISQRLTDGVDLANRLNGLAPSSRSNPSIRVDSLRALLETANARRTRRGSIKRTA